MFNWKSKSCYWDIHALMPRNYVECRERKCFMSCNVQISKLHNLFEQDKQNVEECCLCVR